MAFRYNLDAHEGSRRRLLWRVTRSDGRVIFQSLDKDHAGAVHQRFNQWARQGWPYIPPSARDE